ncbi:MAG: pyridoxal phosphate-dependent aminotransferase [Fibrobacteria bacterium]|nr:pyridoxal phosphate-dependent aminotransferase [Fibrobacteria bacterium]
MSQSQSKSLSSLALGGIDFTPSALREITIKIDKVGGINLGQGVCQMPVPELVLKAARDAIAKGFNRYSPAHGIEPLREVLATRLSNVNSIPCTTENIIITTGSSGAYETLCSTFLGPDDEIVLFSPFYPYHRNVALRKGAKVKTVHLSPPDWSIDFEELEKALSGKPKFLMICTPSNPTGKVFSKKELTQIGELCNKYDVFCVTDEVYEYMTYDGHRHVSMASLPRMFNRTVTMGSYSKTFSITGWRVGYMCVPEDAIAKMNCINDQIYVCSPTPFQHAVAAGIEQLEAEFYTKLKESYLVKRNLMQEALTNAGLEPIIPQGAYYMLADTSGKFPGIASEQVVELLIEKTAVAAIPASEFIGPEAKNNGQKSRFLRFSYSLPDETLIQAATQLCKL